MTLLSFDEKILGTDKTVLDFWQWAYSDVLSNRNRSCFAEYLIASALEVVSKCRIEWDEVDLIYKDLKIEVKSAGFLQSWTQNTISKIRFDISKKKSWNAKTNIYSKEPVRCSDIYIFCLLTTKDEERLNVLDVSQWIFYLIPVKDINDTFKDQKTISLESLQRNFVAFQYNNIKEEVEKHITLNIAAEKPAAF